ncbi:methyltransferase domain-containing protein [Gordoniibacillus kamchatkensis]|uniref:methyltransferase domain-containing protein n=1 Tax=Gordoniibacillus kamchatkensis TaxID=1590651 RepID=UPI000ACEB945
MDRRDLRRRDETMELMDDLARGGEELLQAHRHLHLLNRLFAAAGPAVYGVDRLWRECGRPSELTVLDIGAGSGGINRRLLRWADANGIGLRLVLVDVAAEACAAARASFADEPRVEVRQGSLFELAADSADIVTASQFAHHFMGEELPAAVRRMAAASRLGVVLADIHRHWLAYAAVWLVTRLSPNRYIRHDGPLSVRAAFAAATGTCSPRSCKTALRCATLGGPCSGTR